MCCTVPLASSAAAGSLQKRSLIDNNRLRQPSRAFFSSHFSLTSATAGQFQRVLCRSTANFIAPDYRRKSQKYASGRGFICPLLVRSTQQFEQRHKVPGCHGDHLDCIVSSPLHKPHDFYIWARFYSSSSPDFVLEYELAICLWEEEEILSKCDDCIEYSLPSNDRGYSAQFPEDRLRWRESFNRMKWNLWQQFAQRDRFLGTNWRSKGLARHGSKEVFTELHCTLSCRHLFPNDRFAQ